MRRQSFRRVLFREVPCRCRNGSREKLACEKALEPGRSGLWFAVREHSPRNAIPTSQRKPRQGGRSFFASGFPTIPGSYGGDGLGPVFNDSSSSGRLSSRRGTKRFDVSPKSPVFAPFPLFRISQSRDENSMLSGSQGATYRCHWVTL
jgi:hypothetical protein